jgi:hypothetical protein
MNRTQFPPSVGVEVGLMTTVPVAVWAGTVPVGVTVRVMPAVAVSAKVAVGDRVDIRVTVAVGVGTIRDISTSTVAGKIEPT